MTAPYSDRLRDRDDLLGVARSSMTDSERELWAAKRDKLKAAAAQCKVRWPDVLNVLTQLVISSSPQNGTTDQSLGQLETKTGLGRKTVQRALDALKLAGLLADEKRGGGPVARSKGKQTPQATVRRLLFLVPLEQRRTEDSGPVDNTLTEDTQRANSGHLEANSGHSGVLYYRSSTEPPTPAAVSAEARAGTDPRSGGQEKAREGTATGDRWTDQLAWNVAQAVFAHEREQGTADKVRNPDAVIRTRKLPAAQAWVQQLLARSDGASFRLLEPSDRNLITWGVGEVLGDGGVWAAGEACKQAQALAQQQRPALGVAL